MRLILVASVCAGLCFGGASARADDDLNDLMALRTKVMLEAHHLLTEIRQAWADPACTSPEIEALREKLQALQNAVVQTQAEIRAKVEELPEVKPKVQKMEEANQKIEELDQKIEAKLGAN